MGELKVLSRQEVEVWYILPAIRKEIALSMKKQGLDQKTIASIFKVSPPAISQYFNNKRGQKVKFGKEFQKHIEKAAKKIVEKPNCVIAETQKLLNLLLEERSTCKHCKEYGGANDDCRVCIE